MRFTYRIHSLYSRAFLLYSHLCSLFFANTSHTSIFVPFNLHGIAVQFTFKNFYLHSSISFILSLSLRSLFHNSLCTLLNHKDLAHTRGMSCHTMNAKYESRPHNVFLLLLGHIKMLDCFFTVH